MMKRRVYHSGERFEFEAGGSLDSMDLVYYTPDRDYTEGENVIWVCHALTGNADPEDWWPSMVGKGLTIDPEKCYVVCVSMLCSSYGECGPATRRPDDGRPYLLDFPRTTVRDMVRSMILVRKHLGIGRIDLMLGPSIGGFVAAEWSVMEPDVVSRLMLIATAVRATPFLTAFNESQRMAILADPTFKAAEGVEGGREGLKCARSIALISYRTNDGYNTTQAEKDDDTLFADRAASYQRHQGNKLIDRHFDAYSYWYLTYALDSMNIGRGRGGVEKALASIKAGCTLVAITSDQLFPSKYLRAAASQIRNARFEEIESIFGHDGFLIENDRLAAIVETVISEI